MLRCGRCGRNYYGRTRISKKDNYYTCSSKRITNHNCGNRSLNIDILDDIIWNKFIGNGELTKLIELHYSNINTSDIVVEIQAEIKAFESKFIRTCFTLFSSVSIIKFKSFNCVFSLSFSSIYEILLL